MAHGAHFVFETRPMVGFQKENERSGGPLRYLVRRSIFPRHFTGIAKGFHRDFTEISQRFHL